MKRTGLFTLGGACVLGFGALVGGVGYTLALDVADQAGQTLDLQGVSTVGSAPDEAADSPGIEDKSASSTEPGDQATGSPSEPPAPAPPVVDDGAGDVGPGDVDEVDPSDPVVIPHDDDRWTDDRWADDRWADDRWADDRWADDRSDRGGDRGGPRDGRGHGGGRNGGRG